MLTAWSLMKARLRPAALFGEGLLLARLRVEGVQFVERMAQIILVLACLLLRRLGARQGRGGFLPGGPALGNPRGLIGQTGEGIQRVSVGGRIE